MADKMQGLLELGQVSPRLLPRFLPLSLFSRAGVLCVQGKAETSKQEILVCQERLRVDVGR